MKNAKLTVSVIVPTYNRDRALVDAIQSVLKQDFENYELIIVDQSLSHEKVTQNFLQKINNANIKYFKVAPPSLPAARNFGLEKARAEIIVYIDDDVILDQGFIKAHVDCYKKYPDICAVVGRIKSKGQQQAKNLPFLNKANFTIGGFDYKEFGFVETGQGCNMSFKKQYLKKIGGFDTNYIANAVREEADAFFRLKNLGLKILFCPKAKLTHSEETVGGCGKDEAEFLKHQFYRNEIYFFLKYRSLFYLPYFLTRRLKRFVFNSLSLGFTTFIKRLVAFAVGFIFGFEVYLNPKKQLVSKVIK